MKYVIAKKVISVHIGNIIYKKPNKIVFDTDKPQWKGLKEEIEASHSAGFLDLLEEPKKAEPKKEIKEGKG